MRTANELVLETPRVGFMTTPAFFANWLPHGTPFHLWSGGTLLFCNIAIGVKVGACLFSVLIVLAAFHGRGRGDASEPGED